MLSWLLCRAGGRPAFRIYGKGHGERAWHRIDVFATQRRDASSRLPFFGGTCIAWTSRVIAVGWDFAELVLREQMESPSSRDRPLDVGGGRLNHSARRAAAGAASFPLAGEILAHECGHTAQARRFGPLYLLVGAAFTWWREGGNWWNWFENQASAIGQFGGIVSGTVDPKLWATVRGGHNEQPAKSH